MDHLGAAGAHEKGRLFVTSWPILTITSAAPPRHATKSPKKARAAHEFGIALVITPCPAGCDKGNAGLFHSWVSMRLVMARLAPAPITRSGDLARSIREHGGADSLFRRPTAADIAGFRGGIGLLVGDVLRELDMHRAGPFLPGPAERLAHAAGDIVALAIWWVNL